MTSSFPTELNISSNAEELKIEITETSKETEIPALEIAEIAEIESTQKELKDELTETVSKLPENENTSKSTSTTKDLDGMLDIAFSVDNTGSMQPYIDAVQNHIREIIEQIVASEKVHVRFALVMYRDHKPQDNTFVTRVHDFTSSLREMQSFVGEMRAEGGGDGPESVADSFYEVLQLSWRENAAKICIHISDAPPHGLEPTGDGFPNGCPCGRDPLELAREMLVKGITVYTVGCQGISSFRFAKDFMISVAEITQGQAIALSSASMLANVILGGAREEICLEKLTREVEQEMQRLQQQGVSEEIIVEQVTRNLQTRGMQSKQMKLNGQIKSNISKEINTCSNLSEVRSKFHKSEIYERQQQNYTTSALPRKKSLSVRNMLSSVLSPFSASSSLESMIRTESCTTAPPTASAPVIEGASLPVNEDTWISSTECKVEEDLISYEQVRRVMNKTSRQAKY